MIPQIISNFSSIANLFYATKRPTVHIYPVRSADEEFMWRTYSMVGVRKKIVDSVRYVWKLPPEDNGGMLAHSFDETLSMVDQALDDPCCCEDMASAFLGRHMLNADGRAAERIYDVIQQLVAR